MVCGVGCEKCDNQLRITNYSFSVQCHVERNETSLKSLYEQIPHMHSE